MSEKWDKRYQQTNDLPSYNPWLAYYRHLLPAKGHALDLASGLGQNAFYLAEQGVSVDAWDSSQVATDKANAYAKDKALSVEATCIDMCETQWSQARYDVIYVSYYLQREICPQIKDLLKPGGVLFYQTFNDVPYNAKSSNSKPSSNAFLLKAGELLHLFGGLTPLVYLDSQENLQAAAGQPDLAGKALLIARKPR